ncbi:MAG: tRNA (adenosine(37)-N6)-threonylcarbamoyltransferase complex ATPase subunit type 1 TsaE [Clostridia bacterium]|nr:tRNA (adenosine(37)-N6)-threonylcarbamoyltransferase complex ATPase subunit type 1 TsaE [Clostridia bacterium]
MPLSAIYYTASPEETEQVGELLGRALTGTEVIAYEGGLGMGKTAFTRGLARGLGCDAEVSSPTFALVHQYGGGRAMLYHFDMYRVSGWEDLYSTGFFDYLETGVLAIEWSENIAEALPEDVIRVCIARSSGDDGRRIEIRGITLPSGGPV